ncbi:MAG: 4-(cytidine 5'-diphospho)-2-C-methyl-D-erythritol kinase [Caulobacter sp.]|nr:4-(cytidine 5'-diphospho)-2-C-methyl-D-erythritol kinase [Caulobacter sp.]
MALSAFAPAKVNLFLHVGAATPDGYHPLSSLMVFADVGDTVSISGAEAPEFEITGPFSAGLEAGPDNLVVQAARALFEHVKGPQPPFRLLLDKQLPIAAGLGGGSADAGATLRLLRSALELAVQDEMLTLIAARLGADGPVCLWGKAAMTSGRGDRLAPPPGLPALNAVLVNPRVASSTAAVYRAFDETGVLGDAEAPYLPAAFESAEELAAYMSLCRNDLEAPAVGLAPAIGEVLETLRGEPEVLLARMSGSGATCFALCAGDIEAEGLAERLESMRPDWWVRRCRLG